MTWEIVFMLLILKIPIVYICVVIWWAIREEPSPTDLVGVAVLPDTPPSGGTPGRPRSTRRHPLRPHTPGRRPGAHPAHQRGGTRA